MILSRKDERTLSRVWKLIFSVYVICKFLLIFLHGSLSCPAWNCSQAEHIFWWQRLMDILPEKSASFTRREWHYRRPPNWWCLTVKVKKQSLRKLVRIFDLAFPAGLKGSFITSCLSWVWYLNWFVSQQCLFKVCWYCFVLMPTLHFSSSTSFSLLGS